MTSGTAAEAPPADPEDREAPLSAAAFQTYRLANLRYPQTDIGVVPLVACSILEGGPDRIALDLVANFSEAQAANAMQAMSRAHVAYGVRALPAATEPGARAAPATWAGTFDPAYVTTPRLRTLWRNIRLYVAQCILEMTVAHRPGELDLGARVFADERQRSDALGEAFRRDPGLLDGTLLLFSIMRDQLLGSPAMRHSRAYRAIIRAEGFSYITPELKQRREEFEERISALLAAALLRPCPDAAELVSSRSWVLFEEDWRGGVRTAALDRFRRRSHRSQP